MKKLVWSLLLLLLLFFVFIFRAYTCFHPDISFHPQFQQNWGPVPSVWGTLWITSDTQVKYLGQFGTNNNTFPKRSNFHKKYFFF